MFRIFIESITNRSKKLKYTPKEVLLYLHDIGLLTENILIYIPPENPIELLKLLQKENSLLSNTNNFYNTNDAVDEINKIMSLVKYCEKEIYVLLKHNISIKIYLGYDKNISNENFKLSLNMRIKAIKNISEQDIAMLDINYYNSLDSSEERRLKFKSKIYDGNIHEIDSKNIINNYRN